MLRVSSCDFHEHKLMSRQLVHYLYPSYMHATTSAMFQLIELDSKNPEICCDWNISIRKNLLWQAA